MSTKVSDQPRAATVKIDNQLSSSTVATLEDDDDEPPDNYSPKSSKSNKEKSYNEKESSPISRSPKKKTQDKSRASKTTKQGQVKKGNDEMVNIHSDTYKLKKKISRDNVQKNVNTVRSARSSNTPSPVSSDTDSEEAESEDGSSSYNDATGSTSFEIQASQSKKTAKVATLKASPSTPLSQKIGEYEAFADFLSEQGDSVMADATGLINTFKSEFERVSKEYKKPNVLITGITGAGKSSLINAMFGREVAQTGSGVPITQHFMKYASEDLGVIVYDSKGLETGEHMHFIETTKQFFKSHTISKGDNSSPNAIHVIWYVINSAHSRIEPFEEKIFREVLNCCPLMFLLNKADISSQEDRSHMRKMIKQMNLPNLHGIFDVIAKGTNQLKSPPERCPKCKSDDIIVRRKNGSYQCADCGNQETLLLNNGQLDAVNATVLALPDAVRTSFISSQRVSFSLKLERARTIMEDFWGNFTAVRTQSKFLKRMTEMMAKLSVIWEFREHGNAYASSLSRPLSSAFKWKNKVNLFLKNNTNDQRIHIISVVIVWNRCLRDLAVGVFDQWSKLSQSGRPGSEIEISKEYFDGVFSQLKVETLIQVESQLRTSSLKPVLDNEVTDMAFLKKQLLSDKSLSHLHESKSTTDITKFNKKNNDNSTKRQLSSRRPRSSTSANSSDDETDPNTKNYLSTSLKLTKPQRSPRKQQPTDISSSKKSNKNSSSASYEEANKIKLDKPISKSTSKEKDHKVESKSRTKK